MAVGSEVHFNIFDMRLSKNVSHCDFQKSSLSLGLQDQLCGGRALDVFRRPRLVFYGPVQPAGHLWTPLPLQNRELEYILHVCKKLVLKKK